MTQVSNIFSYENLNSSSKEVFKQYKSEGISIAQKLLQEVKIWKESPVRDNKKCLESISYFENRIEETNKKKNETISSINDEYDKKIKTALKETDELIEKLRADLNERIKKIENDSLTYVEKLVEKKKEKMKDTEKNANGYLDYLESQLEASKEKYEESKRPNKPKTLLNAELSWNKFLSKWEEKFEGIKCPISVPYDTERIIITEEIPLKNIQIEKIIEPVMEKVAPKKHFDFSHITPEEEEIYSENPAEKERYLRIAKEENMKEKAISKVEPPPVPKPMKKRKTIPKRETTVVNGVATYKIPVTHSKNIDYEDDFD